MKFRNAVFLAIAFGWAAPPASADLFVSNYVDRSYGDSILRFAPNGSRSIFAAELSFVRGVAFDKAGNLFVANSGTGQVLEYDPLGNASVFGTGEGSNDVNSLAFDSSGNLFVTEYNAGRILEFAPDGAQKLFASGLKTAIGLAFDRDGNLFVAEQLFNNRILEFAPNGTMSVFASNFDTPTGLAFDSSGDLFVSDQGNGQIVKLSDRTTKHVRHSCSAARFSF